MEHYINLHIVQSVSKKGEQSLREEVEKSKNTRFSGGSCTQNLKVLA